jgi:hypothetical protein
MFLLNRPGGMSDRIDDPRMRAATADIALQRFSDFGRTGIGIRLQERDAAHNHSRRTIGTLEGSGIEKSLLHRMQASVFLKTFDRGDGLRHSRPQWNLARSTRHAPKQYRASATLSFAAAVLRAREAKLIAENRQQRRIQIVLDPIPLSIYFELDGIRHPLSPMARIGTQQFSELILAERYQSTRLEIPVAIERGTTLVMEDRIDGVRG